MKKHIFLPVIAASWLHTQSCPPPHIFLFPPEEASKAYVQAEKVCIVQSLRDQNIKSNRRGRAKNLKSKPGKDGKRGHVKHMGHFTENQIVPA